MVSQPYVYQRRELAGPDWRRFPGWAGVSEADWESAQWQRAHCVKNTRQLRQVTGPGLADSFFDDLERDQRERATMSMLVPPQMTLAEGQARQEEIMGYLPGFATPRMVCDVPYVGKRWVHQVARYDTDHGISYWTKNYRTAIEVDDELALSREYPYYDPIYMLPEAGQAWWRTQRSQPRASSAEVVSLANATG
jgi:hypothetical protein